MTFHVSQIVRNAVFERIHHAEANGHYLNVYEAAQDVQNDHVQENIAIEDIVGAFIDCASGRSLAIEFSQPVAEGHIAIEVIVSENA